MKRPPPLPVKIGTAALIGALVAWMLGVWIEADFYQPLHEDAGMTRMMMLYGAGIGGGWTWWYYKIWKS